MGEKTGKYPNDPSSASKRPLDGPSDGHRAAPTLSDDIWELLEGQSPERIEKLTRNLALAGAEVQKLIATSFLTATGQGGTDNTDPYGAIEAFARVGQSLARSPERIMQAQMSFWTGQMSVWNRFLGGADTNAPPVKDKRFSDPSWLSHPYFDAMQQSYLHMSEWMVSLVDAAEDLTPEEHRKASFFTRQVADAFSPANYLATNPKALKALLESDGETLTKGLENLAADIARGRGRLSISQTDESHFKLGKNIAVTPGKVVFRNDLIELLQFDPLTEEQKEIPLLIFPPWINKYYILDLQPANSMIKWLTEQGFSVFVVSWRSADDKTKDFGWQDYIEQGAFTAVQAVEDATGVKGVNAVGYCIGGTMLFTALSIMAARGDDRIKSATFFASQADFELAGDLLVFTGEKSLNHYHDMIEANGGIMPGEVMSETFNYLRPTDLVWRYVVDNYLLGKKPPPFDLLYWNADQTNIPGPTHLFYLTKMYNENALSRNALNILGEQIDLGKVKIPVFLQAGRDDHIAPYVSIYRSTQLFGGDNTFVLAGSGHIAGVINHPGANKYQHWTNEKKCKTVEEWVAGATEHKGSWWPRWADWLNERSGDNVPARVPGDGKLKPLCDAPGTYAGMRLSDIAANRNYNKG
jgi:polyhydroxyalkanoate synthase subunit PhaC